MVVGLLLSTWIVEMLIDTGTTHIDLMIGHLVVRDMIARILLGSTYNISLYLIAMHITSIAVFQLAKCRTSSTSLPWEICDFSTAINQISHRKLYQYNQ